MKRYTSSTNAERMAEAYWNAYRNGFISVGGDTAYPLWSESSDAIKAETIRCMAHAAETLRSLEGFEGPMAKAFPDKPVRRRDIEMAETDSKMERIVSK